MIKWPESNKFGIHGYLTLKGCTIWFFESLNNKIIIIVWQIQSQIEMGILLGDDSWVSKNVALMLARSPDNFPARQLSDNAEFELKIWNKFSL